MGAIDELRLAVVVQGSRPIIVDCTMSSVMAEVGRSCARFMEDLALQSATESHGGRIERRFTHESKSFHTERHL